MERKKQIQRWQQVAGVIGLGSLAAGYAWFYAARACRAPALHCANGPLRDLLAERCHALFEPYRPTFWAVHTHIQTVLAVLRRSTIDARYVRQLIVAEDGGTIGLDYYHGEASDLSLPSDAPVLFVLHGVSGGSDEGYCKWVSAAGLQRGWRPVVMNYRGCNGLALTSAKTYSAAFTDDVHLALESVRERYPGAPTAAAGYSLGAVILTKYLAEADSGRWGPQGSGLSGAVLVSNPCCLISSSVMLERPWRISMLYNLVLAGRLRQYASRHEQALNEVLGPSLPAKRTRTIAQFDTDVVCKIHGYASLQHYYTDGSSQHHIPAIRTPSLFLVSRDDTFVGLLPVAQCIANPRTALAVTDYGGHVAWLEGAWPFGPAWMDRVIMQFCEATLPVKGSTG